MNCLLIGGIGYLGINLAKELTKQDIEIIILARRSSVEKRRKLCDIIRKYANVIITESNKITSKDIHNIYSCIIV